MESKGTTSKTAADAARILSKTANNLSRAIENAIRFDSDIMQDQAVVATRLAGHWGRLVDCDCSACRPWTY